MSLFTSLTEIWGTAIADLYNSSPRNLAGIDALMQDRNKIAYCGHFSFGVHQWLSRPSYYASIVRDPASRMSSLYYFLRPKWPGFRHRLLDIGFIQNPMPEFQLDFRPWISAPREDEELFFSSPSAELENGMVRRFSGHGLRPERCPPEALAKAKENIEKYFSFVGLLERYPESIDLLARTFDIPSLRDRHVNRTGSKPDSASLSPRTMKTILEMNQLDLALHEWIGATFDARLKDPKPISVMGLGRKDYRNMPLWKGVGGGREMAKKAAGL